MRAHYKHFYFHQLNQHIQDTFTQVKHKLQQLRQPTPPSRHQNRETLDRQFQQYIARVNNHNCQRRHRTQIAQNEELDRLLAKGGSKIKESLQKYQYSKKCKTTQGFYPSAPQSYHSIQVQPRISQPVIPRQQTFVQGVTKDKISHQTRSKTEANILRKTPYQQMSSSQKRRSERIALLTKEMSVLVEQPARNHIFSFNKNPMSLPLENSIPVYSKNCNSNCIQKALKYSTEQVRTIQNESLKGKENRQSSLIAIDPPKKPLNAKQRAMKQIKTRIKEATSYWNMTKHKQYKDIFTLYMFFEQEKKIRKQVKQTIVAGERGRVRTVF